MGLDSLHICEMLKYNGGKVLAFYLFLVMYLFTGLFICLHLSDSELESMSTVL